MTGTKSHPAIVRVWFATLAQADLGHRAWLDDQELGRFHGYRGDVDRARFLLGAAMLRSAAGAHLDTAPGDVAVTRACPSCGRWHGRPLVPDSHLSLSVSHGGLVVALAMTVDGPVGIDVERTGGRLGREASSWTRAEACYKAGGGPGLVLRQLRSPLPGHVVSLATAADVDVLVGPADQLLAVEARALPVPEPGRRG